MYGRCSVNSTEKPLYGERCRPARKPSTTTRAFRSMPFSLATTSGLRKRVESGTDHESTLGASGAQTWHGRPNRRWTRINTDGKESHLDAEAVSQGISRL